MRLRIGLLSLSLGLATQVRAFHDGGAAHCNGCHTMHNSENGAPVDKDAPRGNAFLLIDASPSDVCLSCHATGYGSELSPNSHNPAPTKGGGNFVFLKEANLNDDPDGAAQPIPGDAAGHNLVAPGFGLAADATLLRSPGGTFPSGQLGCTSCHDPHGNGNFRMLWGIGPIEFGFYTFFNAAPVAVGLPVTNLSSEAQGSHTAYRSGMSEWCGNCHGNFHNRSGGRLEHPSASALGTNIANNYNRYNGTANPAGGSQAAAYLAEVPFEDAAMTTTGTMGPTAGSRVMCLSCHRAHASSAPNAGRWDFNVTYLSQDGVGSGSYGLPNPYGNPGQRSLCNKCHAKDEYDAIP